MDKDKGLIVGGGSGADDVGGASPLGGARSHKSNKERTFLCLSTIHMF